MFVKADGNPEEMKKAFMSLIHVIIGLFVISISWVVVKMVSGINF
jgi:flagellar biogenesis protein FliO